MDKEMSHKMVYRDRETKEPKPEDLEKTLTSLRADADGTGHSVFVA